jgi:UDP-N-acetylmuramyl tripeptide synthase
MKNLMNEIKISNRINESIKHLYRDLSKEGYNVSFHKDDAYYFIDIITSKHAMTYVCYDREDNTVTCAHTPDNRTLESEKQTFTIELDLANGPHNQTLLNVIRKTLG